MINRYIFQQIFNELIPEHKVEYMRFEDLCELAPDRLGQDSRYWLDSTKIYKDVGWKAEIDWNIGLKEMVDWGIKYKEQLIKWPKDYTLRA